MTTRRRSRRRWYIGLALGVCGLAVTLLLAARPPGKEPAGTQTCYTTGGRSLQVCHSARDEGIYYQPTRRQIAYNTQIVSLGSGRYATVLHSEAEDNARHYARTGQLRPGDSIKVGLSDEATRPGKALSAPSDLAFRIWGSVTHPRSPLYYAYDNPRSPAAGLSGGANPMVVGGRASKGDPFFYMFYLGVTSDGDLGTAWRNVLLEARTKDFVAFDILARNGPSAAQWVPFDAEGTPPVIVSDVAGHPIVSNQAAPVTPEGSTDPERPPGSVITAGVFGSVAKVAGRYYYFYTDQDPSDPALNHLYLRTADDISGDARWSEPTVVLNVPAEILIRVAKARDADRWAVFYNCLRSAKPFLSDICVQYTNSLQVSGPDGVASLSLFDAPYNGVSHFALGLLGSSASLRSGGFLKAQHLYMTDTDGNLTAPAGTRPDIGGVLTWLELPIDFAIFGAPTYWAEWTVGPTR